ncbi:hypothetical protein BASA60_010566 [Batrachochytrium salamandrivorans]|nr:hypothetical protein BASA60_010566 [Batrachochytrium salamandrivorans]
MTDEVKKLPRNGLLAAAFIVYLAGASETIRKSMMAQWERVTGISDFNFVSVMSTESEQLMWKSQGLPADVTEWLKQHLVDKNPEIVSQNDENFWRSLELAIRFVGEKLIDYNPEFKLYFSTRKSNFPIPTDAVGFVNDINFTITRDGLAGQLLGLTLKNERPELEVQKLDLIKKEDDLKLQLSDLEDLLLKN